MTDQLIRFINGNEEEYKDIRDLLDNYPGDPESRLKQYFFDKFGFIEINFNEDLPNHHREFFKLIRRSFFDEVDWDLVIDEFKESNQ